MKKFIAILFLSLGCSETPTPVSSNPNMLKEALLRSRNVYMLDRNIDYHNPAKISFYQQFADQLIEINFQTQSMNDSQFSVVNSDLSLMEQHLVSDIHLGELDIILDGQNITACVIDECNATNCLGTETVLTSISGDKSTAAVFLNLTKMSQSDLPSCSGLNFSQADVFHTIIFKESTLVTTSLKGARLKAQVLVYNRTNKPEDINNIFIP